jgi:hypothetical protein
LQRIRRQNHFADARDQLDRPLTIRINPIARRSIGRGFAPSDVSQQLLMRPRMGCWNCAKKRASAREKDCDPRAGRAAESRPRKRTANVVMSADA